MTSGIPLAAGFVFLAVMMLISLVAILFRHAIPRAPSLFQALVGVPVVVASTVSFLLAYMALAEIDSLWGIGLAVYRSAITYSVGVVFLNLNIYSLAWYVSLRYKHGAEAQASDEDEERRRG